MSWRKYLLLPGLIRHGWGRGLPPDAAWESYWSAVDHTGPEGDVLWDGAGEEELAWWEATARTYLDPSLPVVDIGCGNGRLSRLLAGTFPAVLGIDVAAAAIEVAGRESQHCAGVRFRQLDVTAEAAGDAIIQEIGAANVVVRGVFHVLDPAHRRCAAATIARVVDARGSVILLETNWPGDLLSYLEHLGAQRGRLPEPLARLIDHRVPRPSSFGAAELAETFPAPAWSTLASGPADIAPVRASGAVPGQTIPGFFAVLRRAAPAAAVDVDSTTADGQT